MKTKCKVFRHERKIQLENEINEFLSTEVEGLKHTPVIGGEAKIEKIMRPPTICHVTQSINSVIIFYM